jgi:hypothetical protein
MADISIKEGLCGPCRNMFSNCYVSILVFSLNTVQITQNIHCFHASYNTSCVVTLAGIFPIPHAGQS